MDFNDWLCFELVNKYLKKERDSTILHGNSCVGKYELNTINEFSNIKICAMIINSFLVWHSKIKIQISRPISKLFRFSNGTGCGLVTDRDFVQPKKVSLWFSVDPIKIGCFGENGRNGPFDGRCQINGQTLVIYVISISRYGFLLIDRLIESTIWQFDFFTYFSPSLLLCHCQSIWSVLIAFLDTVTIVIVLRCLEQHFSIFRHFYGKIYNYCICGIDFIASGHKVLLGFCLSLRALTCTVCHQKLSLDYNFCIWKIWIYTMKQNNFHIFSNLGVNSLRFYQISNYYSFRYLPNVLNFRF